MITELISIYCANQNIYFYNMLNNNSGVYFTLYKGKLVINIMFKFCFINNFTTDDDHNKLLMDFSVLFLLFISLSVCFFSVFVCLSIFYNHTIKKSPNLNSIFLKNRNFQLVTTNQVPNIFTHSISLQNVKCSVKNWLQ